MTNDTIPLARHRVLFVEDAPDIRATMSWVFRDIDDVNAETAICGVDGWNKYREARDSGRPYHLIVTDIAMPDMTGTGFARRIRQSGDNDTIIIFYTAHDSAINRIEAEDVGAVAFLVKPTSLESLRETICALLGGCDRRQTERRECERRKDDRDAIESRNVYPQSCPTHSGDE